MHHTTYTYLIRFFGLAIILTLLACYKKDSFISPQGYNFSKPEKHFLGELLYEISGIAFSDGDDKVVYAVNDEEGKIYYFNLKDKEYNRSRFAKSGDFEDLTITRHNKVVVTRSDGTLYLFPLETISHDKMDSVKEYKDVLPAAEYEGIFAEGDEVFVLCKKCPDKNKSQLTVYVLNGWLDNAPIVANTISVELGTIFDGKKNEKFRPSCLAKNPVTNEWFIISSVNKMLLVLDASWKVKAHYKIDPAVFNQPEGIAFNKKGDLFICNEGGLKAANILAFTYRAP